MRARTLTLTRGTIAGWMIPIVAGCAAACSDGGLAAGTDTTAFTRDKLLDPQTCNQCHQQHFTEWSGSMHAYASKDPVFRAMNARGQKETNGALGDFCVKCHAPMALAEGATMNGTDLDSVPEKLQGVTCYFCHNVTEVKGTHDNPLVLANDQTMRAAIANPLKYKGHNSEYAPIYDDNAAVTAFQSSTLCGSCHDIVVPGHFSGSAQDVPLEQTFTEWQSSVFADPTSLVKLNCTSGGGCHMGRVQRVPIANPPLPHPTMPTRDARHMHDFPAIDISLTDDDQTRATQLAAVNDKLSIEFRIEICADFPNGASGTIEVTLENLSAGHNFPSGASQDRRSWVELHAYRGGQELMSSGVVPQGVAATTVPGTWLLYDKALKADGQTAAHMFWDVASLNHQTIPVSTTANVNQNQLSHSPFNGALQPDRVTLTLWVEPIGLDVLDDMIASGFLDASLRSKMPRIPVQLVGGSGADGGTASPITFEWTTAKALSPDGYAKNNHICTQSTAPLFGTTPPPLSTSSPAPSSGP
ncbi:MAG TPA: multiheme c-type cytochrome [Polyangiaceae bacterium]|jgi:hypothetical protein|nr:multiheme c-type cytochrome [Polyangiaceae bacterium]